MRDAVSLSKFSRRNTFWFWILSELLLRTSVIIRFQLLNGGMSDEVRVRWALDVVWEIVQPLPRADVMQPSNLRGSNEDSGAGFRKYGKHVYGQEIVQQFHLFCLTKPRKQLNMFSLPISLTWMLQLWEVRKSAYALATWHCVLCSSGQDFKF